MRWPTLLMNLSIPIFPTFRTVSFAMNRMAVCVACARTYLSADATCMAINCCENMDTCRIVIMSAAWIRMSVEKHSADPAMVWSLSIR